VLIKLAVRQILTYTVIMQTNPEVAIEISLRPQDVYHPLLFSRRNLARWVLFLFAAYLTFDTRSIWLSALEDPDRSASSGAQEVTVSDALTWPGGDPGQ
jgi:hypothetical protein